jgi:hypothetical protein
LLVGGFDEFGGGAAVIRVNAHANAYADGWLTLISLQPVFDARFRGNCANLRSTKNYVHGGAEYVRSQMKIICK